MSWLITNIKLNKMEWFSTVDKGASGDKNHRAKIVLWKRKKPWVERLRTLLGKPTKIQKQEAPAMTLEEVLAMLPEDQRNVILQALEAAKTVPAQPAPVQAQAPAPGEEEKKPEELAKRDDVPEDVKVELEKQAKEKAELEKRIKAMEERNETIELTKRAESLSFLPMATPDITKMLRLHKRASDEKEFGEFVTMLEKIHKAMKEAPIFKEYGSSGSDGEETAIEKQERLILEKRKADPKLSRNQALRAVMRETPELFAEVDAENRAH